MKLKQLQLQNFQGVKSKTIETAGKNTNIYGTNAAGKTTLFNALTWLLFDKSCEDEPGWSPKPIGPNGNEIHNLETSVLGVFILDNGIIISLKKVLTENWQTKRGYSVETYVGNATKYEIDGVPTTKTEFDIKLDTICDRKKAMVLCKPNYFSQKLHWAERREILLDVCGDITDEQVLESSDELTDLKNMLIIDGTDNQLHSVDDFKKIITAKHKEINKKLEEIPTRIDECNNSLPDVANLDFYKLNKTKEKNQGKVNELIQKLNSISSDTAKADIYKEISRLETLKEEAKKDYLNQYNKKVEVANVQKLKINNEIVSLTGKINELDSQINSDTQLVKSLKISRDDLSKTYVEVKAIVWEGDTVCAYCGQALPEEKIETAKSKFNTEKAQKLENIRSQVEEKCSKNIIADIESNIKLNIIARENFKNQLSEKRQELNTFPSMDSKPFETTDIYSEYCDKIAKMKEKLNSGNDTTNEQKNAIQSEINSINDENSTIENSLSKIALFNQIQERINELMEQEQRLGTELEKINKGIYLCELFIKTKVSMLDNNINHKFNNVKFKLFDTQINGGIKESCEVLIPTSNGLVPYSTANNAAKVNAGLEIIDTLSNHYETSMPVFIDNAESVVEFLSISSQLIKLIVSESDPVLRVEIE